MKQIDFISSENVVNIESPEKINIIGEHSHCDNGAVLLSANNKKNRFNSKKNEAVNHSVVFSKNFGAAFAINSLRAVNIEAFVFDVQLAYFNKFNKKSTILQAMPKEISIRINN